VRGCSVFPSISAKLVSDATLGGDLRSNGIIVRDRQEDVLCFFGADPLWWRTVLVTWSMRRSVRRSMRRMVRIMRMTMWGTMRWVMLMMISMVVTVLLVMAMLVMMSVLVVVFAHMLSGVCGSVYGRSTSCQSIHIALRGAVAASMCRMNRSWSSPCLL